jgi:hypothetical protein
VVDADGGAAGAAAHLLLEDTRQGPEARVDRALDHAASRTRFSISLMVLHLCEPLSKPPCQTGKSAPFDRFLIMR